MQSLQNTNHAAHISHAAPYITLAFLYNQLPAETAFQAALFVVATAFLLGRAGAAKRLGLGQLKAGDHPSLGCGEQNSR